MSSKRPSQSSLSEELPPSKKRQTWKSTVVISTSSQTEVQSITPTATSSFVTLVLNQQVRLPLNDLGLARSSTHQGSVAIESAAIESATAQGSLLSASPPSSRLTDLQPSTSVTSSSDKQKLGFSAVYLLGETIPLHDTTHPLASFHTHEAPQVKLRLSFKAGSQSIFVAAQSANTTPSILDSETAPPSSNIRGSQLSTIFRSPIPFFTTRSAAAEKILSLPARAVAWIQEHIYTASEHQTIFEEHAVTELAKNDLDLPLFVSKARDPSRCTITKPQMNAQWD